jgi:hypothetical protein
MAGGIGPESEFFLRFRFFRFDSFEMSSGSVELRLLSWRKSSTRLVISPMLTTKEPDSSFSARFIDLSVEMPATASGMLPWR